VWGVELENGQRVTVGSEAQAAAFARQAGSRPTRIARRESSLLSGTPNRLKRSDALQAEGTLTNLSSIRPLATGSAPRLPAPAGAGSYGGGAAMSFEQQLISWRRELHQYPELSLQEVATTARIRDWLQSGGLLCCPTI
jgi:hypothetical protein